MTIPTRNAFYLVAFLALLVTITSSHIWSILCYILFQFRSTVEPRDGQHHQHQAIFRNFHTSDSALWRFSNSALFWRGKKRRPGLTALPWALLALLHFISFAIAGILSSRVSLATDNQSEVLVAGQSCGMWINPQDWGSELERAAYASSLIQDFDTASRMATFCSLIYSGAGDCTSYAPQQIRWSMASNAPCPFDPKMCIDNKAVRFDSGLINSHTHLGINVQQPDQLSYRSVLECAPITRDGFMLDWHRLPGAIRTTPNITRQIIQSKEDEQFLEFFYGPNTWEGLNSTFIFSDAYPSFTLWGTQKFSL